MRSEKNPSVKWIVLAIIFMDLVFSGYVIFQDGIDGRKSAYRFMFSHAPLMLFEVIAISLLILFEVRKVIGALIAYSAIMSIRLIGLIVLAVNGFLNLAYVTYVVLWLALFVLLLVKGAVFARFRARLS